MNLSPVISLDESKCINCHACITICPVKYCNDGSGNVVKINPDLCIGCGQCIKACTHKARNIIDDFDVFMTDISKRTNMIAIVAPAVAAVFPHQYLNFNGWLKSIGISANFDVSFGAELTIKSYLEYVKENHPKMVISQPCPALVTYVEIYRPELIPYLAPADSPMLHTARMVKKYYPQYSNYKIAVISPCAAKKREFEETRIGDYNVTFHSIKKYFQDKNISLNSYSAVDYDNPSAERAVLFSTPGGLLRTAERWNPDIKNITRKIEGPHIIYEYLDHLPEMLKQGRNPLLIDCLNCDLGCNGGTATDNQDKSPDELESLVEERNREMIEKYRKSGFLSNHRTKKSLENLINKFWEPGLYRRNYVNLSGNLNIKQPSDKELKSIYALMEKYSEKDIYNCSSCGYGACKNMAVAIYNGLNKHENCHHYLAKQNEKALKQIEEEKILEEEKSARTSSANAELMNTITTINSSMEEMSISIVEISKNAQDALSVSTDASEKASSSVVNVNKLKDSSMEIGNVVNIIKDTASQLHMLALNATIEASRAGAVGKGFAVVADEVKQLSMETARATKDISEKISAIQTSTIEATKIMASIAEINKKIQEFQIAISTAVEEQSVATNEVKRSISDVLEKIAISAQER